VPDRDPPDVLARVRRHALASADELFAVDPLLGDPTVQREVDSFVEQAVDALRAVAMMAAPADPSAPTDPGLARW
jgi:hypothetical protein